MRTFTKNNKEVVESNRLSDEGMLTISEQFIWHGRPGLRLD